ncbi:MAG: HEPN domain-containing protein [Candidatus Zapsychrus exili]|nr:HEPN domain-containing protein [Candidatus Zapsychrus exili]
MKIDFESEKKFREAVEEVELLTFVAEAYEREELLYVVCNKSALLLLIAKFEAFVVNIICEYIVLINKLNLGTRHIPTALKLKHTFSKIGNVDYLKHPHKTTEAIKIFQDIGLLWIKEKKFNKLQIDSKFSFGKHGSKEIDNLFHETGLHDIFSNIKIYKKTSSALGSSHNEKIDFKGMLNSVVCIRNGIIHEDATPSLTHLDINEYTTRFMQFSYKLTIFLRKKIVQLAKH